MRLIAFLIATIAATGSASAAETLLPVPYQAEAVIEFRSDRWRGGDGMALETPRIVVDIGSAENTSFPDRDAMMEATIVGTGGVARGTLYGFREACDYLCGSEGKTCHRIAVYDIDRPLNALGTPLMALVGTHDIEAFAPAAPGDGPAAALTPSASFAQPLWPRDESGGERFRIARWDAGAGDLALENRFNDDEPNVMEDSGCGVTQYGTLATLACSWITVLMAGNTILAVSYADYNIASAHPVASFRNGGLDYIVVRLGLKAQTVFTLFVETGAGWRALIRPRDYPLLC